MAYTREAARPGLLRLFLNHGECSGPGVAQTVAVDVAQVTSSAAMQVPVNGTELPIEDQLERSRFTRRTCSGLPPALARCLGAADDLAAVVTPLSDHDDDVRDQHSSRSGSDQLPTRRVEG